MKKNFYQLKVVKTRKEHECSSCGETILKGSRTLVESGFNRDEGFFSNYFHIQQNDKYGCYRDYLDVMQPSDRAIPQKIEDSGFFGELQFEKWREAKP